MREYLPISLASLPSPRRMLAGTLRVVAALPHAAAGWLPPQGMSSTLQLPTQRDTLQAARQPGVFHMPGASEVSGPDWPDLSPHTLDRIFGPSLKRRRRDVSTDPVDDDPYETSFCAMAGKGPPASVGEHPLDLRFRLAEIDLPTACRVEAAYDTGQIPLDLPAWIVVAAAAQFSNPVDLAEYYLRIGEAELHRGEGSETRRFVTHVEQAFAALKQAALPYEALFAHADNALHDRQQLLDELLAVPSDVAPVYIRKAMARFGRESAHVLAEGRSFDRHAVGRLVMRYAHAFQAQVVRDDPPAPELDDAPGLPARLAEPGIGAAPAGEVPVPPNWHYQWPGPPGGFRGP